MTFEFGVDPRYGLEGVPLRISLALIAFISFIHLTQSARDFGLFPSAFAAGRGSAGGSGVGPGSGGVGPGDCGTISGVSPSDACGKSLEPLQRDEDDTNSTSGNELTGAKIDMGMPEGKPVDLGNDADNLTGYLGKIEYPGKNGTPIPATGKADSEPMGDATGSRRREALGRLGGPAARKHGRSQADSQVDPRSYSRTEVLAVNLSSAALARVRALGFTLLASSASGDGAVTILMVPAGMEVVDAFRLLEKELPAERFQLNRLYRLYRPAMRGEHGKGQRTHPASLGSATRCIDDRCYARNLIRWEDGFAACAKGVRVGVIDTGVDVQHSAFGGRKITQKSFMPGERQPSANWHGTGVLALLAGRPDSGTPGLIPDASFFVASVFFTGDDGEPVADTVSLLRALDWLQASDARLVNMSFSGPSDELVRDRIAGLSKQGFIFVAAAGNDGPAAGPGYPAAYPQVIAVTAVTKDLRIFPFANQGPQVDLAAPGVRIWTAIPDGREGYRSGTSFAAPFATAILSIQQHDALRPPKDVLLDKIKIIGLGEPGRNPTYGRGLLQAPSRCPVQDENVVYRGAASSSQVR